MLACVCLFGQAMFFSSNVNQVPVIPYCTAVGYPGSPVPTGLTIRYSIDSIAPCSGGSVSALPDSSGNGNDATITAGTVTCGAGVLNGHQAISVSGTPSGSFTSQNSQTLQTVFVVFLIPSFAANTQYAFFGSSVANGLEYRIGTNGSSVALQNILNTGIAQDVAGIIPVSANTWHQIVWDNAATSSFLHLDRAVDATSSSILIPGSNRILNNAFGPGEYFNGKIAEMLYYSGSGLSSSDVVKNECYLYGKYGI